jgi:hypothetical protein
MIAVREPRLDAITLHRRQTSFLTVVLSWPGSHPSLLLKSGTSQ